MAANPDRDTLQASAFSHTWNANDTPSEAKAETKTKTKTDTDTETTSTICFDFGRELSSISE